MARVLVSRSTFLPLAVTVQVHASVRCVCRVPGRTTPGVETFSFSSVSSRKEFGAHSAHVRVQGSHSQVPIVEYDSKMTVNANGSQNVNGHPQSADGETYEVQANGQLTPVDISANGTKNNGNGTAANGNANGNGNLSTNPVIRLIQNHYNTGGGVKKSPGQIRREHWLIPGLLVFNRWALMPAAIVIQFCCGSLYSWSVFNKPIDRLIYGEVRNMAPITFYIAVGCFGSSAAIMGPWLERHGPMPAAILGTCLFFAGNLVTALALFVKQIWLVYIGYGVIAGFGLGLCYISPVSALQKWFPDKRGLASGFAVCGFGAGSIAIAKVQIPLIDAVGLPYTFIILGGFYFILMLTSALVLRTPPPKSADSSTAPTTPTPLIKQGVNPVIGTALEPVAPPPATSTSSMSLINAITSRSYRLMYIMFFANAIFGLVVISRLSNMITDIFGKTPEEASTIVSINGGFNLGGRLAMSIMSDYVGRKNCYVGMLTTQLVILASFSTITTTGTYWAFLLTIWMLTACYGAGFGVIPAFLTDKFGSTNIGACHGIILTAWSIAGVAGGLIFTAVFDRLMEDRITGDPYPYNINVWWIFGVVLIGWFFTLFIEPTPNDRRFLGKIKRLVCCGRGGGGADGEKA